jgi:drug/metabolite transporter (DMT)-like permease
MGLAEVIGFTCFAIGAQYEVAITSVLASQFAPIAAVMAYVLFREKLGRLQITGVAILVAGVTALSLAS